MNKVEDVVNILTKVREGILNFYIENEYIYCENVKTGERAIVSNVKNQRQRRFKRIRKIWI